MVEVLNQHSLSIQICISFDTALANDREQSQIKIAGQLRIQNLERQKERRENVEVDFPRTTQLLDFASLKCESDNFTLQAYVILQLETVFFSGTELKRWLERRNNSVFPSRLNCSKLHIITNSWTCEDDDKLVLNLECNDQF
ncbi:hypothetical protein GJ496_001614 [Pomphorhynchus laevis]|nr:hypothetical protein GJ496_001614 [Pomphorhynchus laevis]